MAAERRMRRMATLMRLRITWMPHLMRVRCHLPRRPSAARRLPAQARLGVGSPPNQAPGGCLLARAGGRRALPLHRPTAAAPPRGAPREHTRARPRPEITIGIARDRDARLREARTRATRHRRALPSRHSPVSAPAASPASARGRSASIGSGGASRPGPSRSQASTGSASSTDSSRCGRPHSPRAPHHAPPPPRAPRRGTGHGHSSPRPRGSGALHQPDSRVWGSPLPAAAAAAAAPAIFVLALRVLPAAAAIATAATATAGPVHRAGHLGAE